MAQPANPVGPGIGVPIDPGAGINTTHINETTANPAALLAQAIRARRNVTLCKVEIDMSGVFDLELHAGQTLRARAGCERSGTNLGPRIFFTDRRRANQPLFIVRDSNVKISGFRLQGPTAGIGRRTHADRALWEDGLAIKIRGVPEDRVLVDANVFALSSAKDAIVQNPDGYTTVNGNSVPNIPRPIQVTANNLWGAHPLATLGRCDFDGDGRADDFMATGVTWWARSSLTQQWRYLGAGPVSMLDPPWLQTAAAGSMATRSGS